MFGADEVGPLLLFCRWLSAVLLYLVGILMLVVWNRGQSRSWVSPFMEMILPSLPKLYIQRQVTAGTRIVLRPSTGEPHPNESLGTGKLIRYSRGSL